MDPDKQTSLLGQGGGMHNGCICINSYTDQMGPFNNC